MVSVIVPVYNSEKYICRCLDSILAQSYTDFELLLINDGSKDTSGVICEEYSAKDSRVRVFHRENGGVSSARNMGLDNAKGEWVTFIDSDDWVESEYLMALVSHLDVDIVVCSVNSTDGKRWIMHDDICSTRGFIDKYIDTPIVRAPWGALLRLDIINRNGIRFDSHIRYGEDMVFNMQYFLYCETFKTLDYVGYNYFQYPEEEISTKKYDLTLEETLYSLTKTLSVKDELNKKNGTKLSYDIDYMVYLGLWPIEKMVDWSYLEKYYNLCKSLEPTLDRNNFYNHKLFSPIIRGITEIKVCCEERRNKEYILKRCKAIYLISSRIQYIPKFPYKDFYLWFWLIKNEAYRVLFCMLNVYVNIKRIVKNKSR